MAFSWLKMPSGAFTFLTLCKTGLKKTIGDGHYCCPSIMILASVCLCICIVFFLIVQAQLGTFSQETALEGAFSVIVKTFRRFAESTSRYVLCLHSLPRSSGDKTPHKTWLDSTQFVLLRSLMEYGARLNSSCSTPRETNKETHIYYQSSRRRDTFIFQQLVCLTGSGFASLVSHRL